MVSLLSSLGLLGVIGWTIVRRSDTIVSELIASEARARHLAYHDPLTRLPNRALLFEQLDGLLQDAASRPLAVLCVDLDRFKEVNDTLGHGAGDALIEHVANCLRGVCEGRCVIARQGGDEFVVLSPATPQAAAKLLAERMLLAVTRVFESEFGRIEVGCSIGAALIDEAGIETSQALRWADLALYRAKDQGRGRVVFFEPDMDTALTLRRSLETDLRGALTDGSLHLAYQPQLDRGGEVIAVEALLRWNHPERGLLLPDQFIPIAEERGLIHALGGWAIDAACAQASRWTDAGLNPQRISVNVSGSQLLHKHLIETVRAAMAEHRITPGELDLELEITESVLQSASRSAPVLTQLRELGVRIAIDDFGTGYSSLGVLKHMPIDTLKIDRLFIRNTPDDGDAQAIAKAMIVMAHGLGLHVVAEGVETPAQCRFLLEQGCDEVQGHLYSPALPAEEVPALLARRTTDVHGDAPT